MELFAKLLLIWISNLKCRKGLLQFTEE